MQDNEYLTSYYRPQIQSVRHLIATGFFLFPHNETALGDGGLSALGDAAAHLRPALSRLLSEAWLYGFGPLLLGVCACMASSTAFHIFWNFSPAALKLLSRIDYCAIALLCASHSLTGSFWGFYCSPTPATTTPHTVGVLAATAATVVAIMHPRFDSPAFRTTRAVTFSVLGGICFTPLAHLGAVSGWHPEFTTEAVWLSGVAAAYLAGAILFATRYPECCARKGRYDLLGASHQLMHVCVIGAAALHWYVCVRNFRYRLVYGCTLSPLVPV
ncbi:hypothetical protein I4F81_004282 [Pyropia yezoensis]|uniref:Uncharacterized protein n=1 Tax=Pyropia yezoensis TaxID=2788 RepID=A0ACC3BVJ8_PYRYE|nr:hypothetical protein I4F81_004282 [Neopyropia yezoensis]